MCCCWCGVCSICSTSGDSQADTGTGEEESLLSQGSLSACQETVLGQGLWHWSSYRGIMVSGEYVSSVVSQICWQYLSIKTNLLTFDVVSGALGLARAGTLHVHVLDLVLARTWLGHWRSDTETNFTLQLHDNKSLVCYKWFQLPINIVMIWLQLHQEWEVWRIVQKTHNVGYHSFVCHTLESVDSSTSLSNFVQLFSCLKVLMDLGHNPSWYFLKQ